MNDKEYLEILSWEDSSYPKLELANPLSLPWPSPSLPRCAAGFKTSSTGVSTVKSTTQYESLLPSVQA